jgi:hypothetical protein
MRNYYTTGDLSDKSKKTRQQIWNLWMDRTLPAELINSQGPQLRFKKTRRIDDWCAKEAAKANRRAARQTSRQYRFWTPCHQALLGRLVEKGRKGQLGSSCDLIAFNLWKDLSLRNRLSIDELDKSFRRGIVTRIKREERAGSAGVTTWTGIVFQFEIIRRRIAKNGVNGCQKKKLRCAI